jgi:hypothetical protein
MSLLKKRSRPAPAPPPEPQPTPPAALPDPDEQRRILRREIDLLRQEIADAETQMDSDRAENDMENKDLTQEEEQLVKQFRESHASAAEQKARFEKVYNTPVGKWSQADTDWMQSLMPALLQNKLPF